MDTSTLKDKLGRFGRTLALLLNRGLMYQKSHPMVRDSIKDVHKWAEILFNQISPVVFILNRELFYIDEEQLDPRINVKRIAHIFKTHGLQSVSFEAGLTESEIDIFIEIFAHMTSETNAETVKKELLKKGAYNIRVNHVLYKKVTEDDQVISREALKQVTPSMEDDDSESRKKFMDTLLETILTDEFANTLNIKSLLDNPGEVSKNMIKADLASVKEFESSGPGGAQGLSGAASSDGGGTGGGVPDGAVAGTGGSGIPGTGGGGGVPGTGGGDGIPGTGGGGGIPGTGGGGGIPGTGGGGGVPGTGGGDGIPGTGGGGLADTPGSGGVPDGAAAGTDGSGMPGTGDGSGAPGSAMARAGGSGMPDAGSGGGGAPGGAVAGAGGGGMPGADGEVIDMPLADEASSSSASTTGRVAEGLVAGSHGHMLLHQLDLMQQEVRKHLEGGGDISLEELANAVFEMKKQLFEDIQTQKALGIAYANEEAIVDNINELTDQVLLSLIHEEYNEGKITTQRLAQIITRLIPDTNDLKRLMPQIKQVLMDAGMSPEVYLELVDELKLSFQNEDLARIIEESSEAIGVDSEDLIQELKDDSGQAAKLIYLASEIRKGGGDEAALSDILVDYVEKLTNEAAKDGEGGEDHLRKVISDVESTVLGQLASMDVGQDVLLRMEERINDRMDSMLDRMRVEWLRTQAGNIKREKTKPLTVLQTIEHNVGDDETMVEILKAVRAKVEEDELEENNFSDIHLEIERQKAILAERAENIEKPEGVLSPNELMFILEKEIARANRYNAPFSALAFSFVHIKPKMKALENLVSEEAVMNAALDKLVNTIREGDYLGQAGKNKMVALLPMQIHDEAKQALGRMMALLNNEPLMVNEIPVNVRVAGVFSEFDQERTPTAQVFAKSLTNQLMDMVSRLKNIQVLF